MTQNELESAYQKALDAAARQLGYRAMSVKSLRNKLKEKGHSDDAVDYAIAYLEEHGLINDDDYANMAVQSYMKKGYGKLRIQQELRRRGISKEQSEQAVSDIYETDFELLRSLLDKKLKGDISDPKEVRRAVAFLQRRGFLWDDIKKALAMYGNSLFDFYD